MSIINKKQKLNLILRKINLTDKLRNDSFLNHFEWLYEDGNIITKIYRYYDTPLTRDISNKFTERKARSLVFELINIVESLHKRSLMLIKMQPDKFRMKQKLL